MLSSAACGSYSIVATDCIGVKRLGTEVGFSRTSTVLLQLVPSSSSETKTPQACCHNNLIAAGVLDQTPCCWAVLIAMSEAAARYYSSPNFL
jgi:hypothetical protein